MVTVQIITEDTDGIEKVETFSSDELHMDFLNGKLTLLDGTTVAQDNGWSAGWHMDGKDIKEITFHSAD